MLKRKKRTKEPVRLLYIPIGLFLGLGVGVYYGQQFIVPSLCGGMVVGLFLLLQDQKREHRNWIKEEKSQIIFDQFHDTLEMEAKLLPTTEMNPYIASTLQAYRERMEQIGRLLLHIPNGKKNMVADILLLLEKVYHYVEKDPARYGKVKVFFQTYITSTETILEKYVMLLDQPVKNDEATSAIRKIERVLLEMKGEYERAYVKLYEEDISQVHVETDLLRNTFKEEKLIKWP